MSALAKGGSLYRHPETGGRLATGRTAWLLPGVPCEGAGPGDPFSLELWRQPLSAHPVCSSESCMLGLRKEALLSVSRASLPRYATSMNRGSPGGLRGFVGCEGNPDPPTLPPLPR